MRNRAHPLGPRMERWLEALRDEEGQDSVEYALLAAVISLGSVVSISAVAVQINTAFSTLNSLLSSATIL